MKKFLILFILILFVTVSCAGPNKVGWTKPHFRQDEFEKDRKECMQTLNKKSYSQTSGVLADCLAWKGYEYTGPARVISQDQFEKDRKDCIQALKDDTEQKMTVEECLSKKKLESEPQPSSDKEKPKTAEIAKHVGKVLLTIASFTALAGAIAALVVIAGLAG